jgi:hypothetical protein
MPIGQVPLDMVGVLVAQRDDLLLINVTAPRLQLNQITLNIKQFQILGRNFNHENVSSGLGSISSELTYH